MKVNQQADLATIGIFLQEAIVALEDGNTDVCRDYLLEIHEELFQTARLATAEEIAALAKNFPNSIAARQHLRLVKRTVENNAP